MFGGHEEHSIASAEAKPFTNALGAFNANIPGDRPGAPLLAFAPENVGEAGLAFALGPVIHAVAEGPVAASWRWNCPDLDRVWIRCDHAREHLEARVAEVVCHTLHLDRVAQIGLVAAIFSDGCFKGNPRKLLRHRLAVAKFLEHPAQHRLDRREHVILGDEAHLDIELVELAGRAVRPRLLVAKAWCDLEIAVQARNHDELL